MDAERLDRIAVEGYEYFYPMVLMEVTRKLAGNRQAITKPGYGPPNQFSHFREFPPGDFKEVVRPNFDTLYSMAWLDLTNGPQVISITEPVDRYFMLPLLDMWTDVFALIGTRTSGGDTADYAIVPDGWEGDLPAGMFEIDAPTPYVWIIGRTQTNGPSDYEAVHRIQDGFRVTPLSDRAKAGGTDRASGPDLDLNTPPKEYVNSMSGVEFFTYATELLGFYPPHVTDQPMIARLRYLGIEPGQPFDAERADRAAVAAIEQAPKTALAQMNAVIPTVTPIVDGWSSRRSGIGVYGTDYLYRAVIAMIGLGANLAEDAIYPLLITDEDGEPPTGEHDYVLHFDADSLPPVDAFWSVTMYDGDGYTVPNPLGRYAIGDRDALEFGEDGSLDIYISRSSPGPRFESNWLPATEGPLGITMRLYNPRPEILDGRWNPPPLRKK